MAEMRSGRSTLNSGDRRETPDGDAVAAYLIKLIQEAHRTGNPAVLCVAESRDGGMAYEHGRLNLDEYSTCIEMLANLLFMITAGTKTPLKQALSDLATMHAEFAEAYRNRQGIPL